MHSLKTLQKWLVMLILSLFVIISFILYFGLFIPLLALAMPITILSDTGSMLKAFVEFWKDAFKDVWRYFDD
ncbi:hypothetical protein [Campylobacter concisus]